MPRRMPFAGLQSQRRATISTLAWSGTPLSAKAVRLVLARVKRLEKRQARVSRGQATWPWCWRCRCLLVRCQCPVSDMTLWYS